MALPLPYGCLFPGRVEIAEPEEGQGENLRKRPLPRARERILLQIAAKRGFGPFIPR